MKPLLNKIKNCTVCAPHLSAGVRPVVQASPSSRILIIGQAPGRKVHESGVPWDDASGDQLRNWLGVDKKLFYNPDVFAFMPMGFCYPGSGKTGDLAPRKECAPLWHDAMLSEMKAVKLTVLIGLYAQQKYLGPTKQNLTEHVKAFKTYLPEFLPLPHPSPRNRHWQSKNSWFKAAVLPALATQVQSILKT